MVSPACVPALARRMSVPPANVMCPLSNVNYHHMVLGRCDGSSQWWGKVEEEDLEQLCD